MARWAAGLTPHQGRWLVIALSAGFLAAYVPHLGAPSGQTRPEEQFNMAVSAEMHRAGAWATPTLDGAPWFYKPPLLYWLQRTAYLALGPSVFAARLPPVLAALALVLVVAFLARRLGAPGGPAALWCAGSLALFMNGRLAITDALLALSLALVFACLWEAHQRGSAAWLVAAGAAAGLGVLTKGPVAAVIAGAGAVPFLVLRRRPRPDPLLRVGPLGTALLAGLAVSIPWYALMLSRHQQAFFDFFFVQMNVDRFRSPWTWSSMGVLWGGLVGGLLPWAPLAIAAVVQAVRGAKWREAGRLLLLSWAGAVMLVFSLPSQKFPHYGLPAVAPLALLTAWEWAENRQGRLVEWGRVVTVVGCLLVAAGGLLAGRVLPVVPCLLLAAAAAGAGAAYAWSRPGVAAGAGLAALACALGWLVPAAGFSPWPAAPLPERALAVYRQAPGLIELSSGRVARYLTTREQVEEALGRGDLVWMLADDFDGPPSEVLASQPRLRTAVTVREIRAAVETGSMAPLLDRVLVVGRPKPP